MHKVGIEGFPYYLGINSLADIATKEDRVCVLNILGSESRQVTPVSHAFSGGNVVFGTSPGRRGQILTTANGDIPVYNNVREGLDDGLAVADSWNRIRIGGALGGDFPDESLIKGTVAIFSNSGGFTTTIAQYLATEGWGTTTVISSGKDIYIHYAMRDFAHAFKNDDRSKAAALYSEPGGYYELGLDFGKPVVACVVGRWKSKLTRAVGHAGAMAGAGDRAEDKERWFMDTFGVDALFTPGRGVVSAKGAVVTNIAHIPAALTAVMK